MKKLFFLLITLFITVSSVLSQTVVICGGKYATKYHSSTSCRGLNNCKGGLYEISVQDAVNKGRSACSICNPTEQPTQLQQMFKTQPSNQNNVQNEQRQTQSVSEQCSATTKKGTRCLRMTKSSNGLCWQHGGN